MKKSIFSKFAGLQTYSWPTLLTYELLHRYFSTAFYSLLPPLPMYRLNLPMFSTPVRNPGISVHWGNGKFYWEGNFYVVVGI